MSEVVGDFFYKKKDLIGHGAFAVVFKGRHRKKEDFVVAVKVITKKNLSKSQNLLSKEIRILKELHHENVVSLFDCKETSSNVQLVMEYCNGGDLADYLQAKGTLSEDTICIFLKQIASAMCTLQSKGIVHRDLKPQNLLLSHSGKANPVPSEIKIKIADFGFARFLPGEMMAATLCGSPMYMAPEVIMSKVYDAKADLWSVGTIVYQCLTGKAPFQASTPQALKKFYEKSKIVSPVIPAGTSDHLRNLLMSLLRRSPKDRIDFASFFGHPFLTGTPNRANSTPMAVPGQQHRKYGGSPQRASSRSPSSSPNFDAEALGDVRVDVLHHMTPPYDITGTSPQDPPTFMQVSGHSPGIPGFLSQHRGAPESPQTAPDNEIEDFVIVPPSPDVPDGPQSRNPSDPLFPCCGRSPPRFADQHSNSPCSPRRSPINLPHRRATFTVGSPSSCSSNSPPRTPHSYGSPTTPPRLSPDQSPKQRTQVASPRHHPSLPVPVPRGSPSDASPPSTSRPARKTSTGRCLSPKCDPPASARKRAASVTAPKSPAAKPVRHAVPTATPPLTTVPKAISTALQDSPPLIGEQALVRPVGTIQRAMSNIEPLTGQECSPILTALARQTNTGALGIQFGNIQDCSENKQIIRVHSSPAVLALGLHRNKSILGNKGFQLAATTAPSLTSPIFRRHSGSGSQALRQQESPPVSASPPLPTIPGSPTKLSNHKELDGESELKPLRGLFTVGSSTPPSADLFQFGSLPSARCKADSGDRPAVVNQGNKITRGFAESPCPASRDQLSVSPSEAEPCSPDMEGPIALIAPELPEDTLMETEHTEGVRKLNFASSLVDAILEVISARGTPLTTLADSMALNLNESFLTDQIGFVSEECRRTEQLVLYVKALRVLNAALLFAKQEIKAGHLKPSNTVKNVINDLNEQYHRCLESASQLKKVAQPLLGANNRQAVTVSADKLMYTYAMELCQNAALDELFGNPRECKKKYETAQFLLQGLEEDAHQDRDRSLLRRYKIAVHQRLHLLTKTRLRRSSQTNGR